MSLRRFFARLRSWRKRDDVESELTEEIRAHLQIEEDEQRAAGVSAAEARDAARRAFGNVTLAKEASRDAWIFRWAEELFQDVRYALRQMRRNPGFTAVAILTLALGIGANTAIFSILDPLLLRKLPVQNPDELVLIHGAGPLGSAEQSELPSYFMYRDNSKMFLGVLAAPAGRFSFPLTWNGRTKTVDGLPVSGNFFTVLGVRPFRGRLLTEDDSRSSDGNPVLVLSFDYWRREFNGDDTAIGKTILFQDVPHTIIGVAPPDFFGIHVGEIPSFYWPIGSGPGWSHIWVDAVARLKPGVSVAQAQAGLDPVFRQVMAASSIPEIEKQQNMSHVVLSPIERGISDLREKFSLAGKVLMAVVGLILLIACSNVASLLFARGAARQKEITVRLALGAGRWRLVRQLLTESTLLGLIGATVGVLAAIWMSRVLIASIATDHSTALLVAGVSSRVLVFTGGVLVITVLLFGLAPALAATRGDLAQGLKVQSSGSTGATSHSWLPNSTVVIQVALSVTVLAGAGLLLHSLYNLETADLGFDRDNVIAVSFDCCDAGRTPEQSSALYDQIMTKAKSLPGVRSAGFSEYSQTSGQPGMNVAVEGFTPHSINEQVVLVSDITASYFETLGIPILAGRDFTERDNSTAPSAAIINRTMARHYFGDGNPIGRHFRFLENQWAPFVIVGVVADSIYNDVREKTPDVVYINTQQLGVTQHSTGTGGVLNVRAIASAKTLAGPLRDLIRSFDKGAEIKSIRTLREQVDISLHQDRLIAALCSTFSLLALGLTCVGLYGTLSFNVASRTKEIGVRMALGACKGSIFRLVIRQGMRLVIVGLVIGAAGALASASLLAKLLFGVKGADPVTFVGMSVVLIVAAILACYLPARRAMRVDPMTALRYE